MPNSSMNEELHNKRDSIAGNALIGKVEKRLFNVEIFAIHRKTIEMTRIEFSNVI